MSTMGTSRSRESWQAPAELLRSVPRETRFTAAGKTLAGIATALVLGAVFGGVGLYVAATRDAARFHQLESQSVLTAAEVVGFGPTHGDDRRRVITYQYSHLGQTHTGRVDMRRERWRTLRVGSQIVVRYVPANPGISWLRGYEPKGVPLWAAVVFPACALLVAWLIAHSLHRQRGLLAEGRPAPAQVTQAKKVQTNKSRAFRVSYEFKILSGATRTGYFDVQKDPPPTGSTFTVLYHPEEPKRNARYPLSLVRTRP